MPHDNVNGKVNDDLISRKKAEELILKFADYYKNTDKRLPLLEVMNAVHHMPPVDAAPVVHGRWIWVKDKEDPNVEHLRCSACMGSGADEADGYCRHCGAKMDLEEQHEQTKDSQTAEGTAENVHGE